MVPLSVTNSNTHNAFDGSHFYTAYGGGNVPVDYNPVRFGGQYSYYHESAGHYLLGHRFYDVGMGRFVTRDPISYKGGINLYGFTGNNPVNESDPSGYNSSLILMTRRGCREIMTATGG